MAGRPQADIDWDRANQLLMAGCSGAEVASCFGLNKATIYERCVTDHGITFTEYSKQFYEKGDSLLREVQYRKAIDGDNMMLVWVGKNRLKQRDKPEENNTQQPVQVYINGELASGINVSTAPVPNTTTESSK